jgi:hypothetical protein
MPAGEITAEHVCRIYHGDGDLVWTDQHVGALVRELEERDEQFDKGYEAGRLDAWIEILQRLRANANATGLPACHDCVIDIANWLDPRGLHA